MVTVYHGGTAIGTSKPDPHSEVVKVLFDAAGVYRPTRAAPEDVSALLSHQNQSGYQGVYLVRRGDRILYRVRVLHGSRRRGGKWATAVSVGPKAAPNGRALGTFPTVWEAVATLVAYYRAKYGENWRAAFRRRKARPWRVKAVKGRGWRAEVCLMGRWVGLTRRDADPKKRLGRAAGDFYWPTPVEARAAVAAYMTRTCRRHGASHPAEVFWRA